MLFAGAGTVFSSAFGAGAASFPGMMLLAGAGALSSGAFASGTLGAAFAAAAVAGLEGAASFAAGSFLSLADMATADILGSVPPVLATWLMPLTPLMVSLSEDLKSIVLSGITPSLLEENFVSGLSLKSV